MFKKSMFRKSKRKTDNDIAKTQKHSLTKVIISLTLAIIAWVGAVTFENYLLSDKSTAQVIIATKTIEEGTLITSKNRDSYFTKKTVNSSLVTPSVITDANTIKGKASIKIDKGEIITSNMYHDASYVNKKFKNPVEITFSAKDVENSVIGTLRAGDLIDIISSSTNIDGETTSTREYSNVYIISAYDEAYAKIKNGDTTSQAVYFKIYLEKSQEEKFATLLNDKNIMIAKVKQGK